MVLTKVKQSTIIDTNFAIIKLTHGMTAIIDPEDFEEINKYFWHAKKSFSRWYAMRKVVKNGKEYWVRMHRQIMNTPIGQVTHHKNRRTMDNRRSNLENMFQQHHRYLHQGILPRMIKRETPAKKTSWQILHFLRYCKFRSGYRSQLWPKTGVTLWDGTISKEGNIVDGVESNTTQHNLSVKTVSVQLSISRHTTGHTKSTLLPDTSSCWQQLGASKSGSNAKKLAEIQGTPTKKY